MATLFIRAFPDDLKIKLKVWAASEKRTLYGLVIEILTKAVQTKEE